MGLFASTFYGIGIELRNVKRANVTKKIQPICKLGHILDTFVEVYRFASGMRFSRKYLVVESKWVMGFCLFLQVFFITLRI